MSKNTLNYWTDEEIEVLKDITLSHKEVVEILTKRSYQSVKLKRLEIGVNAKKDINYWTEDELKFLAKNRQLSNKEISKKIGRSVDAIQAKRAKLNIPQLTKKYDAFEVEYLIVNYNNKKPKEIADYLGRSISSIQSKASEMGLTKKHNYWSEKEIAFLKQNIDKNAKYISKHINKSKAQIVYKKAHLKSIEIRKTEVDCIDKNVPFSKEGVINQFIDILSVMEVGDSFELPTKEYSSYILAKNHLPKKIFSTKRIDQKTRRVWRLA